MLRNYIKTVVRIFFRNKAFSTINILGLSLGMACSLLIFLWVQDELNIDTGHSNNPGIYSVYERVFSEGKVDAGNFTPGLLATELKKSIPDIRYASSFDGRQAATFERGEKIITTQGAAADSDFFKIFNYKLLQGTASSALTDPSKIAISRKMAENFFGSPEAAINKTIRYNNAREFKIAAVFENLEANSSDQFDYVLSWTYHINDVTWLKEWIYRSPKTFVQLTPGAHPEQVERKIKNFLDLYIKGRTGNGFRLELGLQPYKDIYLHSTFKDGKPAGGRIEYVRLFSIVAIFILLIAGINFMNLSTARSVKRAKEVGIRKTIGARRPWLIAQFIGEAIFFTSIAVIISVVLVAFLLPVFNHVTGKQIELPLFQGSFWAILLLLVFVVGFSAGSYPALFLSSLNPVKVLKGSLKFSWGAIWFRKGLVIFQFVLSIVLIIGTLIISRQINYIENKNLGFNRENLVYIPFQGSLSTKYNTFKQELSGMPGIKMVSRSDQQPTRIRSHAYDMDWAAKNPNTKAVVINNAIGYDFIKIMNLKLIQGRDFSRDFPTDSNGYIVNETALKITGYKDPIGQPLSLYGHRGTIIGVIKDFHFTSLHDPIEPLVLRMGENIDWGFALVRTETGKTKEALASIEKVYKGLEPKFPFAYSFSDEEYLRLYQSEEVVGHLSDSFALLAIFISCLGLLGLSIFTAEQRTREIGVRKVLGASEMNVFRLLSKEFMWLVGIAFIIASPLAWLIMNNWLQDYAYKTEISWWLFAAAGASSLLIALITVSFQTLKAAFANPVTSLRTE